MGHRPNTTIDVPELDGCTILDLSFAEDDYERLARYDRAQLQQRTSKRSCIRKHRMSERQAARAARCLRRRGEAVHAYACNRCGGWHVGHDAVAHVPAASRTAHADRRSLRA